MRMSVPAVVAALSVALAAPTAYAQSAHTAPQSALDAAVHRQVSSAAADREAVRRVLDAEAVKGVAQQMGIDLRDAQRAVATLDDQEVGRIAAQARQVEQALAGGASTITISTTAIIIGLLIIILIIVAS